MTADLVCRAVAGHHMRAFLAGDRKAAVSAIVSSCAGWTQDGGWGQVSAKGVTLTAFGGTEPLAFVTWAEVTAAIQRGARPELVADFDAAWALWTAWVKAGGYGGFPFRKDMDDAERAAAVAHQQAYGEATRAMRVAADAIITAGYAEELVQLDLFGGAA